MTDEQLRDFAVNYLYESGFVKHLTKKLMFPSDIDELYDDYVQECWLAILELSNEKWRTLYDSALKKNKTFGYEIRNYVSVVVRNTVRSTSSGAYKRLKKNSVMEQQVDDNTWKIFEYEIPDDDIDFGSNIIKTRKEDVDYE